MGDPDLPERSQGRGCHASCSPWLYCRLDSSPQRSHARSEQLSQSDRPTSRAGDKRERESNRGHESLGKPSPREFARRHVRGEEGGPLQCVHSLLVCFSCVRLPRPASQSEETPGRPPLHFQGPTSQPEAREALPCTGRCPKSERLQSFMPRGGMHQWRPQAGEVCGFRRSNPPQGSTGGARPEGWLPSIWKDLCLGRSRLLKVDGKPRDVAGGGRENVCASDKG